MEPLISLYYLSWRMNDSVLCWTKTTSFLNLDQRAWSSHWSLLSCTSRASSIILKLLNEMLPLNQPCLQNIMFISNWLATFWRKLDADWITLCIDIMRMWCYLTYLGSHKTMLIVFKTFYGYVQALTALSFLKKSCSWCLNPFFTTT